MKLISSASLRKFIENSLEEDIGSGDVTTESIVPQTAVTRAVLQAKAPGIIAGLWIAEAIFHYLSPELTVTCQVQDGTAVAPGTTVAVIEGNAGAILSGERLALNVLQRLSGIATRTHTLVALVHPYQARIVDTRKTVPGLRMLDKYAVRMGGGYNHRYGLYDAVLIKDNHIAVAGGITQAVYLARKNLPHTVKVEVEVETLAGVREALAVQADIIMLDNMALSVMAEAVALINHQAIVEASGKVDETTVAAIAKTGVDIISVGALTHSVTALDISLDIGEIRTVNT